MNLQQLNSGVPDAKLWLNPVVNRLTANEVITPVMPQSKTVFKMGLAPGLFLPLPPLSTTPCDTIYIDNPNISLAANTYTADRAEYILVSCQWVLGAIAGGGQSALEVLVNGAAVPGISSQNQINSGGGSLWSCNCSGLVQLAQGDVLSVRFVNTLFGGGWIYTDFSFAGVVV